MRKISTIELSSIDGQGKNFAWTSPISIPGCGEVSLPYFTAKLTKKIADKGAVTGPVVFMLSQYGLADQGKTTSFGTNFLLSLSAATVTTVTLALLDEGIDAGYSAVGAELE